MQRHRLHQKRDHRQRDQLRDGDARHVIVMGFLTPDQWELVKTILLVIGSLYAILDRPLGWLYNRSTKKLVVEIENKRWQHSRSRDEYTVHWNVNLKFTNKLSKDTTIHEMVLEYKDNKKLPDYTKLVEYVETMLPNLKDKNGNVKVEDLQHLLLLHFPTKLVKQYMTEKYGAPEKINPNVGESELEILTEENAINEVIETCSKGMDPTERHIVTDLKKKKVPMNEWDGTLDNSGNK